MLEGMVQFSPSRGERIFGGDWNMVENDQDRSTHNNKTFEGREENAWD